MRHTPLNIPTTLTPTPVPIAIILYKPHGVFNIPRWRVNIETLSLALFQMILLIDLKNPNIRRIFITTHQRPVRTKLLKTTLTASNIKCHGRINPIVRTNFFDELRNSVFLNLIHRHRGRIATTSGERNQLRDSY